MSRRILWKMNRSGYGKKRNSGTTLVEMIVSFALLSIFLASAAAIISLIANQYYHIKGETYSKQVADIVMQKVASEIAGAKYEKAPEEGTAESKINPSVTSDFKRITLSDRTDTRLTLRAEDGKLLAEYEGFTDAENEANSRAATTWRFDDGVYNGYTISELYFVPGDQLDSFRASVSNASAYGFPEDLNYGSDVYIVFMKLHSEKYEDYYVYRVIKAYYAE